MRDYLARPAILLIEWPERGKSYLPEPDINITLTAEGTGRCLQITTQASVILNL